MQYSDPYTGERYIPWCIEASFGLGRQVMVTMLEFYDEENLENGESRVVIRFPKQLAPVKFAILLLLRKTLLKLKQLKRFLGIYLSLSNVNMMTVEQFEKDIGDKMKLVLHIV